MNAGRELDALVAEKVMGWQDIDFEDRGDWGVAPGDMELSVYGSPFSQFPNYSTDIAAAWEVVDHLGWQQGNFYLKHIASDSWGPDMYVDSHWVCVGEDENFDLVEAKADTAPHAICLAALRATGVEL